MASGETRRPRTPPLGRAVMRVVVGLQSLCPWATTPCSSSTLFQLHPALVAGLLCQGLCCAGFWAVVLLCLGHIRMPVELFWWPQSAWLGGAGDDEEDDLTTGWIMMPPRREKK